MAFQQNAEAKFQYAEEQLRALGSAVAQAEEGRKSDVDQHRKALDAALAQWQKNISDTEEKLLNMVRDRLDDVGRQMDDKHAEARKRLDSLSGQMSTKDDLQQDKAVRTQHLASIQERVSYLEQNFGDSADAHAAEVKDLKAAHEKHLAAMSRHARESGDALSREQAQHATVAERLNHIEKLIGDSAAQHEDEVTLLKARNEKTQGRLTTCETSGVALRKNIESLTSGLVALKDRFDYVEGVQRAEADKFEVLTVNGDKCTNDLSKMVRDVDAAKKLQGQTAALGERVDALQRQLEASSDEIGQVRSRLASYDRLGESINDVKKSQDKLAKDAIDNPHHAGVQERLSYIENLLGDSADQHAAELAQLKKSHDQHKDAISKHAKELEAIKGKAAHHATLAERVDYLENFMGSSADKHSSELEAAHVKADALHGRLLSLERQAAGSNEAQKRIVPAGQSSAEEQVFAIKDRVDYLETLIGDSMDKHAKELRALKDNHSKHSRDAEGLRSTVARHATLEDRLEALESSLAEASRKLSDQSGSAQSRFEKVHARLSACEAFGATLGELKQATSGLSDEKTALAMNSTSLRSRMDCLEKMLSDSAEKQGKLLEASHAKIDALQVRVAGCERAPPAAPDLSRAHSDVAQSQASLVHRVQLLEAALHDFEQGHAKDFEEVRAAHGKHQAAVSRQAKELDAVKNDSVRHASWSDRLEQVERTLEEHSNRHSTELGVVKDLVAKERDQRDSHNVSVKHRVEHLESVISSNTDRHARDIAEAKSHAARLANEARAGAGRGAGSIEALEGAHHETREAVRRLSQELEATRTRVDGVCKRLAIAKEAFEGPHVPAAHLPSVAASLAAPALDSLGSRERSFSPSPGGFSPSPGVSFGGRPLSPVGASPLTPSSPVGTSPLSQSLRSAAASSPAFGGLGTAVLGDPLGDRLSDRRAAGGTPGSASPGGGAARAARRVSAPISPSSLLGRREGFAGASALSLK